MSDINVTLSLDANGDIERLQAAMNTFASSVKAFGGQVASGGGAGPAYFGGKPSPGASDAAALTASRGMGWAAQNQPNGSTPSWLSRSASRAGGVFGGAYKELPGNNLLQKAGWALAFGPQVINSLSSIGGAVSGAAFGGGATMAGTQLGQSNSNGLFGGGLGSTAFKTGVSNTIGAQIGSILTGNPFLPGASGIAQQGGYNPGLDITGGMYGTGANVTRMLSNAMQSGVSEDSARQFMEMLRYGGTNVAQLSASLGNLNTAAAAAHVSTAALGQSLADLSVQYAKQTGAPAGQAVGQIRALSTATGMAPESFSGVLGSHYLSQLAVGAAGGNVTKATTGRNAGYNNLEAMGRMLIPAALGMRDFQAAGDALKRNPSLKAWMFERLQRYYFYLGDQADTAFFGMTPETVMRVIENASTGNLKAGFHAAQDLTVAHAAGGKVTWGQETKAAREYASSIGISYQKLNSQLSGNAQNRINQLVGMEQKRGNLQTGHQTGRYQLALTGYAAKILKQVVHDYGGAPMDTGNPANIPGRTAPGGFGK